MTVCPKCKSTRTHRSHRRGLIESWVSLVGFYPYSCGDCRRRFLRLRTAPILSTVSRPGVEREIKATRGALKARQKRREWLLYSAAIVLFLAFLYYLTRDRGSSSIEGGFATPVTVTSIDC